jgi:hypothetical protein
MLNKPSFQTYYGNVDRMVSKELASERPEYLLQVDFEELLAALGKQIVVGDPRLGRRRHDHGALRREEANQ